MLLQETRQPVGISPGLVSTPMRIEATARAFQAITSGIYTDKIRAVIREISTNAHDGHIANGNKEEQFDVHLPTMLNPTFYVRDYGIGLTPEEMENIYTVLFKSTKTNDPESTGCWGLGCKSPFCYRDNFTVESYKDGMKHVYIFHLNEDGEPCSTPVGSYPTTERSGVKVSVAVDESDFYKFIQTGKRVYKHFVVTPKFVGAECPIEVETPMLKGDGWESYGNNSTAEAVMANVAYPIVPDILLFTPEENNMISYFGLRLYFDNGTVQFDLGREKLTYDRRTVAAIKERLKSVQELVLKEVQTQIDACANKFEARKLYRDLSLTNKYVKHIGKMLTYQGKPVTYLCDVATRPQGITIRRLEAGKVRVKDFVVSSGDLGERKHEVYIEVDDEKEWKKKVKYFREDYVAKNGYSQPSMYLVMFVDAAARQAFCEWMGFAESYITKTSSLPKPPASFRTYGGGMNHMAKVNVYTQDHRATYCWTPTTVDFDADAGVYVEILRGKVIMPSGAVAHPAFLDEIIDAIKDITGQKVEVYGVKRSHAIRLIDNPDWLNIWQYAKELIQDTVDNEKDMQEAHNYIESSVGYLVTDFIEKMKKIETDVAANSEFTYLREQVNKREAFIKRDFADKIAGLRNLAGLTGIKFVLEAKPIDFDSLIESINKKYPLFKFVENRLGGKVKEHIVHYINQIDKGDLV